MRTGDSDHDVAAIRDAAHTARPREPSCLASRWRGIRSRRGKRGALKLMIRLRRIPVAVGVAAAVALGGHSALSTAAATKTITVKDDVFSPKQATIRKNTHASFAGEARTKAAGHGHATAHRPHAVLFRQRVARLWWAARSGPGPAALRVPV